MRPPPRSTLFPYTTLFRSLLSTISEREKEQDMVILSTLHASKGLEWPRSEEHTSELQSLRHLVCRLLLEKKNEFYSITDTLRHFRCRQRRATAQKWLIYQFPKLSVVQNRPPHQFHWFLRRMIELLLVRPAHDELGRWRSPDGRVLSRLSVPPSVFLAHVR